VKIADHLIELYNRFAAAIHQYNDSKQSIEQESNDAYAYCLIMMKAFRDAAFDAIQKLK